MFQDIDLFQTYEVDRMFVLHMIAVDSEFGGRGIGTQLVLRGIEHATRCVFLAQFCTFPFESELDAHLIPIPKPSHPRFDG